jgi:hypothetical protein
MVLTAHKARSSCDSSLRETEGWHFEEGARNSQLRTAFIIHIPREKRRDVFERAQKEASLG